MGVYIEASEFQEKAFQNLKMNISYVPSPNSHPVWNSKCLQASGGTLEEY